MIVFIIGVPGAGKSTLVNKFKEILSPEKYQIIDFNPESKTMPIPTDWYKNVAKSITEQIYSFYKPERIYIVFGVSYCLFQLEKDLPSELKPIHKIYLNITEETLRSRLRSKHDQGALKAEVIEAAYNMTYLQYIEKCINALRSEIINIQDDPNVVILDANNNLFNTTKALLENIIDAEALNRAVNKQTSDQLCDFCGLTKDKKNTTAPRAASSRNYCGLDQSTDYLAEFILKLQSNISSIHDECATAQRALGQLQDALQHSNRTFELKPNHPEFLKNNASMLFQQNRLDEAITLLRRLVVLNPHDAQSHSQLSKALDQLGLHMEADWHYQHATKLNADRIKSQQKKPLTPEIKSFLMSAYKNVYPIILEDDCRLLFKGNIQTEMKTDSYSTRSWDQYFSDLSTGSFRAIISNGLRTFRQRAWHFAFKNMSLVNHIFNSDKNEVRILDVGCGRGYFRRFLEGNRSQTDKKQIYYWGLDLRETELRRAVLNTNDIESGANGSLTPTAYIVHDVKFGLPFKDNFFDIIINFEMLKYLPVDDGKNLLKEFHRVLKTKGELYLSHSYTAERKGYMESISFPELAEMIKGIELFQIKHIYGSQHSFDAIKAHLHAEHKPLFDKLTEYYPKELVAVILAPFYPEHSSQIVYVCQKEESK